MPVSASPALAKAHFALGWFERPWLVAALLVAASGCSGRFTWLNSESTHQHLLTLKSSSNADDRRAAFGALGQPGRYRADPGRQQQIVEILRLGLEREQDSLVRITIVHSLGSLGGEQAQAALVGGLEDGDPAVRAEICRTLGKLGDVAASEPLGTAVTSDTSLDVRLAAAEGLGHLPSGNSAKALLAALNDKDPAVRYRAGRSLRAITGKDYGTDSNAWNTYLSGLTDDAFARRRFFGLF